MKLPLPQWIPPQLTKLVETAPSGPQWLHEIKLDGFRVRTNHDLDYVIERNNMLYGVEVKNQLGYIDQTDFQTKLQMCEFFGVRPLFATRMMPTNVNLAGGYAMITQNQNYPLLAEEMARRTSGRLQLPVAVIGDCRTPPSYGLKNGMKNLLSV